MLEQNIHNQTFLAVSSLRQVTEVLTSFDEVKVTVYICINVWS